MDGALLQGVAVGAIVLAAAGYVGRKWWRTLASLRAKEEGGCGEGCGCSATPPRAPRPSR